MFPNATIKTYYLHFIRKAKQEYYDNKAKLKVLQNKHSELKDVIRKHKDYIRDKYGLSVDKYNEYTLNEYNPGNALESAFNRCVSNCHNVLDKNLFSKCLAYCYNLTKIDNTERTIAYAKKRIDIKPGVYEKYIRRYYEEVHKQILEGNGYKFTNQIGTLVINHWKTDKPLKTILDYKATAIKKKELQDKGIKIYNDNEAAWYAARHIPYDGVDYRVFKEDNHFYEICFINTKICNSTYVFKHSEYVNAKLRGITHQQIADKYCHTFDDIVHLPVDIKVKLNILLYKDPNKYLNFVRNADQFKHKH